MVAAGLTPTALGGLAQAAAGDPGQSRGGMGEPARQCDQQLAGGRWVGVRCAVAKLLYRLPGARTRTLSRTQLSMQFGCGQFSRVMCSVWACMRLQEVLPIVSEEAACDAQARDALAVGAGKTVLGYLKGDAGVWDTIVRAYQSKGDIRPIQSGVHASMKISSFPFLVCPRRKLCAVVVHPVLQMPSQAACTGSSSEPRKPGIAYTSSC